MSILCFNGLGQSRLFKLSEEDAAKEADGSYYAVKLGVMEKLEVRAGLAKYGADIYFDKNGHVIKIVRLGKTFKPGQGHEWECAKLAFRGSLQTLTTAVDHLVGKHTLLLARMRTSTMLALTRDAITIMLL